LQKTHGLSPVEVEDVLYHQSGLFGVSGISGDMRVLAESADARAREAIEMFAFRVARETAALANTLEGLDALVFTGGIGEHDVRTRADVCRRLAWLGVTCDLSKNEHGDTRIDTPGSRVAVLVIPADEESVIARYALALSDDRAALATRPRVATDIPQSRRDGP
jgi:acetate kinase